jgi:hypothetical protein
MKLGTYFEIYSIFLPICTAAMSLKQCASTEVEVSDMIQILIPKLFSNYVSKCMSRYLNLNVIPSLKLSDITYYYDSDKKSNHTSGKEWILLLFI